MLDIKRIPGGKISGGTSPAYLLESPDVSVLGIVLAHVIAVMGWTNGQSKNFMK